MQCLKLCLLCRWLELQTPDPDARGDQQEALCQGLVTRLARRKTLLVLAGILRLVSSQTGHSSMQGTTKWALLLGLPGLVGVATYLLLLLECLAATSGKASLTTVTAAVVPLHRSSRYKQQLLAQQHRQLCKLSSSSRARLHSSHPTLAPPRNHKPCRCSSSSIRGIHTGEQSLLSCWHHNRHHNSNNRASSRKRSSPAQQPS